MNILSCCCLVRLLFVTSHNTWEAAKKQSWSISTFPGLWNRLIAASRGKSSNSILAALMAPWAVPLSAVTTTTKRMLVCSLHKLSLYTEIGECLDTVQTTTFVRGSLWSLLLLLIAVIVRLFSALHWADSLQLYTPSRGCLDSVQTTAFVRGLQYQRCCSGSNHGWFIVVVAIADLFVFNFLYYYYYDYFSAVVFALGSF